jgi:mono/diheme cytochrome c family protein
MRSRGFLALCFAATIVVQIAAQTTRSVWDGVYSADQAKRGQEVYGRECASCHGSDLSGGESAPALAGAGFLSNWTSLTVGDLFDRTQKSMPQNTPGKLNRAQTADVVAYMLSANRFPEGKAELDKQTEALKQIRIDEKK